jgi:hypothetical protein
MLRDRKHTNKHGKPILKDIYVPLDYEEIMIPVNEINELRRDIASMHGVNSSDVRFVYFENI